MSAATVVEWVVCLAPLIGAPVLAWFDPANLNPSKNERS